MEIQEYLRQADLASIEQCKKDINFFKQLYQKHIYDKMGPMFREIIVNLEDLLEHEIKAYERARSQETDRLGGGNATDAGQPQDKARDVFI